MQRAVKAELKKTRSFKKSDIVSYAMLSPYLIFYILITLLPLILIVVLSFTDYNMFNTPKLVGLSNFIRIFTTDEIFTKALTNTLVFAVFTGPISFILCFIIAWIINGLPAKLRAIVTLIFYAPSISGTAFVIWSFIFSPDMNGIANGFLLKFNIINEPLLWFQDTSMSLYLLIIIQIWMSLGTGFLAFIAGLQNIDSELYEAGSIDGIRSRWQELWYITLPSMKPMLLFGGITQITAAFSVSDISMVLTGFPSVQYSTHTLSLHAYDSGIIRYEMGYAAAISVVLFLLILFTYKLFTFLLSRMGR